MLRDSIAKFLKIDSLIDHLTGYFEARVELLKIEAKEEISKGLSSVLVYVALAFAFLLAFMFVSVAVALLIGAKMGDTFMGFFIVAGFYLLVGVVLVLFREALAQKIEKKVSIMFNKKKQ
jgi:hypothetical protein